MKPAGIDFPGPSLPIRQALGGSGLERKGAPRGDVRGAGTIRSTEQSIPSRSEHIHKNPPRSRVVDIAQLAKQVCVCFHAVLGRAGLGPYTAPTRPTTSACG